MLPASSAELGRQPAQRAWDHSVAPVTAAASLVLRRRLPTRAPLDSIALIDDHADAIVRGVPIPQALSQRRVRARDQAVNEQASSSHPVTSARSRDSPRTRVGSAPRAHGRDELTIDELAQRTGMTVRNIRAHQSRGLLSPPQVRGRTGFYGPEHIARIEVIREMQAEGYNLELIRRLLDGGSRGVRSGPCASRARCASPSPTRRRRSSTLRELAERMGTTDAPDPSLIDRAVELRHPAATGRRPFRGNEPAA